MLGEIGYINIIKLLKWILTKNVYKYREMCCDLHKNNSKQTLQIVDM